MDDYGVLPTLLYNQAPYGSPEGLARVLGFVHLYRASGIHLLAFFTAIEFLIAWVFRKAHYSALISKWICFFLCMAAMFWIWHIQDERVTLIRPIGTFLIRSWFRGKGVLTKTLLPLALTFIFESLVSWPTSFSEGALHYYLSVAAIALASARTDFDGPP